MLREYLNTILKTPISTDALEAYKIKQVERVDEMNVSKCN